MPKEFNLELDPDIDEIFDEGVGSSFLAMRKLRWNPDSDFKLDLRKWFTKSTGEEVAGKGFSFITDNGPNELVDVLLKHNYGDTKAVLDEIRHRDDFIPILKTVMIAYAIDPLIYDEQHIDHSDKPIEDAAYFDPRDLFNRENEDE